MALPGKTLTGQSSNATDSVATTTRARWSLDDLLTADGHRLSAIFSCCLRILSEPAEQKFFAETFLSVTPVVAPEQILAHFRPGLHSTAAALAERTSAANSLDEAVRPQWLNALRTAGDAIAFSSGIALLPPFSLELTSPSLQREKLAQMQRAVTERSNADRAQHFQRAADLLRQWESLKTASPHISPGRIMEQLGPADRGPMLESLLLASAGNGAQPDLWAVAGSFLVRIPTSTESTEPQLIPLPTDAGPLRSVQLSDNRILVGAQRGVIAVDKTSLSDPSVYTDPDLISDHGFTAATTDDGGIWACHHDGGIVFWENEKTEHPSRIFRAAELRGIPRHVVSLHSSSSVLFAVDEQVMQLTAPDVLVPVVRLESPVMGILSDGDRIIVVAEDGNVKILDGRTMETISAIRPMAQVTSAALMPWLSDIRILLTTPDGPIYCLGVEDQLITQYSGPHLGVRRVAGSNGKVAAMSADRQRVIFWNTWDGRRPAGEIHLTGITRHRVADIAFG